MKFRMVAVILALSAIALTQVASPNAPQQNAESSSKTQCCCKTGTANGGQSCARHNASAKGANESMECCGKDANSCCGGKEVMSCKRADKDKAASCADCMKNREKQCCAHAKNANDQAKMSCCTEHCAAHASGAGN
jgi:hypothetical protein